jgi:integrase
MTVRPRKTKKGYTWEIDETLELPNGKKVRLRKKSPENTKKGAEKYLRQWINEVFKDYEQYLKNNVEKFMTFAKFFIKRYAQLFNKPSEVYSKEKILKRHLIPFFGNCRLDKITKGMIMDYCYQKSTEISLRTKKPLSNKTINNHLTVLHKILDYAVEKDRIKFAPKVKWLKVVKPEIQRFSREEMDELIKSAENDWRPMVDLAFRTAMRKGELVALRWKDVDFERKVLTINQSISHKQITTPKSGKERKIPITDYTVKLLKSIQHNKSEYVFCKINGSRYEVKNLVYPLYRACKNAGLERCGWHKIRHTTASVLVDLGIPVTTIKEILGHSNVTVTQKYTHLNSNVMLDALQKMDSCNQVKI